MDGNGRARLGSAVLGRARRTDGGGVMSPSVSAREAEYVTGLCARYWTPSVELADKALSAVSATIKRTKDGAQLVKLRQDLDSILERRLTLELDEALTRKV